MKKQEFFAAAAAALLAGASVVLAQAGQAPAAQGRGQQAPPQPMSFFVASTPKGDGANYGGLAGADAHCQSLAAAAGRGGVMWHAYLSTQGANAVNARDRIGNGPWYNARGQAIGQNVGQLHGDTIEQARIGNNLSRTTVFTEKQTTIPGAGDTP